MANNEERRFWIEKQNVDVSWYKADGRVLDIYAAIFSINYLSQT